ncbi:hypothetical protein ACLKA7_002341 [Drosophila subpalustris]
MSQDINVLPPLPLQRQHEQEQEQKCHIHIHPQSSSQSSPSQTDFDSSIPDTTPRRQVCLNKQTAEKGRVNEGCSWGREVSTKSVSQHQLDWVLLFYIYMHSKSFHTNID